MSTTSGPEIPTRRKLLYLVVLMTVAVLAAEGAVRARAWHRYGTTNPSVRDAMLAFNESWQLSHPRPGYELKAANLHIKVNSLGFRGDEIAVPKPKGTIRIVCLGASTTFSAEASSNAMVWTALLQQRLREDFPQAAIEVVNAAYAGYTSSENVKNLRHRVLPIEPDLVIYYEANNEIVKDTRALAMSQGLVSGTARSPLVRALVTHSLLANLVEKNLAILARQRAPAAPIDDVPATLPARFIENLEEMRRMLAERDVPLVLSTFVVKYRRDQDRQTQIANADVSFFYMPWMSIDGMLAAMDRYNQAIVDYGAKAGLHVVDDRFAIPADARHFVDCMHLADQGNIAMAERFRRGLRESRLVERLVNAS